MFTDSGLLGEMESSMDAVSSFARRRKEQHREESLHLLMVVRDGGPCAVLSSPVPGMLLQVLEIVGAGFGADALALVLESVVPLVELSPLTGRAWVPGEMEQVWLEHDGVAKCWVSEALVVLLCFRDQR